MNYMQVSVHYTMAERNSVHRPVDSFTKNILKNMKVNKLSSNLKEKLLFILQNTKGRLPE